MKPRDAQRRPNRTSRPPQFEQAVLELPIPMPPPGRRPRAEDDERDRGVWIVELLG